MPSMRIPRVFTGPLCLILLAAFAASSARAVPTNRPAVLASLSRAAADPGLADWQRDFYRARIARLDTGAEPAHRAVPNAALSAGPTWTQVAQAASRMGHTLVIDSLADRAIAFGGSDGTVMTNDVFTYALTGGGWRKLVVDGPAPAPRWGHVAVMDAPHRRMLVYGGCDEDGSYLADVWALSLDGTPAWTQLAPGGVAPSARSNHSAVVDTVGNRVLVFGGTNGGLAGLADLWALSLGESAAWTQVTTSGSAPTAFTCDGMLIDGVRHTLWFCGVQTIDYSSTVLFYSLPLGTATPAWSRHATPTTSAPYVSMPGTWFFLDQAADRFVCTYPGYYAPVSTLPAGGSWTAWTVWAPDGTSLPQRFSGSAWALDARHRRVLMSGGGAWGADSQALDSDLWSLDLVSLAHWDLLASEPPPRYGHAMAIDPNRGRIEMYGGETDTTWSGYYGQATGQLWSLALGDSTTWSLQPSTGGPMPARIGSSLIVDPVSDRLLVFGGEGPSAWTNEIWQRPLSGTAWGLLPIAGMLPHQRSDAATVYDPVGHRLLVFGGYDGSSYGMGYMADLWALGLGGVPAWTKLVPAGPAPCARAGATLVYDPVDTCAYLVGGYMGSYYSSSAIRTGELWRLSLGGTPHWQELTSGIGGDPEPYYEVACGAFFERSSRSIVRIVHDQYDSDRLRVLALAPGSDTVWTELPQMGTPPQPSSAGRIVYDPASRRMYWFGGTGSGCHGTWALEFGSAPLAVPTDAPAREAALLVSPNPAGARVTLHFALLRPGRVQLELLDLAGRRVRGPIGVAFAAGPAQLVITDAASLPAGVYFARLSGAIESRARVAILH